MSIVVTGATGHLGRLVVANLLERGVPAADVTAAGRSVDRLDDLAGRRVPVVAIDYDDVGSLRTAFADADVVVLVSASEVGKRASQHRNAIDAAVGAGVGRLIYTSIPRATETPMLLAQEHRATEEAIRASGLPWTVLRNAWYIENYTRQVPTYLQHGMVGSAGDGRVSVALRREYAEAAAAVAVQDGHEGRVYELGGDAVTLAGIAALLSAAVGSTITYTDVPEETFRGILVSAGLPEALAAVFADVDTRIKAGDLGARAGTSRGCWAARSPRRRRRSRKPCAEAEPG